MASKLNHNDRKKLVTALPKNVHSKIKKAMRHRSLSTTANYIYSKQFLQRIDTENAGTLRQH